MSEQRSIGLTVLTSDDDKAVMAWREMNRTHDVLRDVGYDYVSVYSNKMDEELEVEDIVSEGPEDEEALSIVRQILIESDISPGHVADIMIAIHAQGVIFRLKGQ